MDYNNSNTAESSPAVMCAVCRYHRRKCREGCQLAPYFPEDQPERFQVAHRLYGVRNMVAILRKVPEQSRKDAMTSIMFESEMRNRFKVHGCLGVTRRLEDQIAEKTAQLAAVRDQIARRHELLQIPIYNILQHHDATHETNDNAVSLPNPPIETKDLDS